MITTGFLNALKKQDQFRTIDIGRINNPPITVKKIQMDPWQLEIANLIKHTNDSLIVNVTPAAGKTWPIMDGLNYLFLNNKIKKVLFCVPIQFLAAKLAQDIKESSTSGLIQALDNTKIDINLIDSYFNQQIGVRIGSGSAGESPTGTIPSEDTKIDIATYEHAAALSQEFKYDITIIDEFQEALPLRRDTDVYTKANNYSKIISKAKRLIILTGSLNRKTITELAEFIENYYDLKIKIHPPVNVLSNIRNRSDINIFPSPTIADKNKLLDLITHLINNRNPNNLVVIFSRIGLLKNFIEPLLKRLPKINNLNELKHKSIAYTKQSDDRISEISRHQRETNTTKLLNIIQEPNQILFQCLERGFGYIIGGTHITPDNTLREIDYLLNLTIPERQLVSELFINKKIYVVIATDSVGLGVTIDVKNLYIPSIKKYDGSKMTTVDMSSLIQILNRAGRGKFPTANIYCHPDDVSYIKTLIYDVNPVINIDMPDSSPLKIELISKSTKIDPSDKLVEILKHI